MQEPVQAPVSRKALQEWLEDRYGIFMDVYQDENTVHGWKCEITGGECGLIFPNTKYCPALDNDTEEDISE